MKTFETKFAQNFELTDEENGITNGLDFYKPTMSQLQFEKYPRVETTFRLINRDKTRKIVDFVNPQDLQQTLDEIRTRGFSPEELTNLKTLLDAHGKQIFSDDYLNYLNNSRLPRAEVLKDNSGDLCVETHGIWPLATFWETVAMGEINRQYMENYILARGGNLQDFYDAGDERLSAKIEILKQHPEIILAEFGTRRRFSPEWQKYVISRLKNECPENLAGTSNVAFAISYGLKPIGTYAHEMPMVYEGIASLQDGNSLFSHAQMMQDWREKYPEMDTALTDTFGSDFFWQDFTRPQIDAATGETFRAIDVWRAVRHDSGNPLKFGDEFIEICYQNGINPLTKTICFSDALDIKKAVKIAEYFKNRVNFNFGIGTNLTNDLGVKPLNVVMKAVEVSSGGKTANLAKLSDDAGKTTGEKDAVARILREKSEILNNLTNAARSLAEETFDAETRARKLEVAK